MENGPSYNAIRKRCVSCKFTTQHAVAAKIRILCRCGRCAH